MQFFKKVRFFYFFFKLIGDFLKFIPLKNSTFHLSGYNISCFLNHEEIGQPFLVYMKHRPLYPFLESSHLLNDILKDWIRISYDHGWYLFKIIIIVDLRILKFCMRFSFLY